jgi:hypothetical protein
MTAVVVVRGYEELHIATDGLHFGGEPSIAPKVYVCPNTPMILVSRGDSHAKDVFADLIHESFSQFDDVVSGIEAAFPMMYRKYLARAEYMRIAPSASEDIELVFGGWSSARRRTECYFIRAGIEIENYVPPWQRIWIADLCALPTPTRAVPFGGDIEGFMLATMEAQREDFPQHVGGFCQITSLSEHGIAQRILRRWPADAMLARSLWQTAACA